MDHHAADAMNHKQQSRSLAGHLRVARVFSLSKTATVYYCVRIYIYRCVDISNYQLYIILYLSLSISHLCRAFLVAADLLISVQDVMGP